MDVGSTNSSYFEMTQPCLFFQLQIDFSKSKSTIFLAFRNTVFAYYSDYALWLLAVSWTSVPLAFSSAPHVNYVASKVS